MQAQAADPGSAPPRLRDRDVQLVAALAVALVLAAWWWSRGYNLADSIEYLQIAERLAAGERLADGPRSVRPPAFALLLAPLFLGARAIGVEDLRAVVPIARVLSVLLAVALVLVTFRLGARLAGRSAGRVAGIAAATSPALLRFGSEPLSDVAAAVLIGLGVERLLLRARPRTGGLLLGAACLVSYKALPLVVPLVLFAFVRRPGPRVVGAPSPRIGGALVGLGVVLAVGGALDRLCLGGWWLSLRNYLVYNVAAVAYGVLGRLGLREAAASVFEMAGTYYGKELDVTSEAVARRIADETSSVWYTANLDGILVAPLLALFALGAWTALRRRIRPWGLVLGAVALYIGVLSFKHAKSMRLLLPVLPLAAPFAALGWSALQSAPASLRRPARALAAFLLLLAPALAWMGFLEAGARRYGHYWSAAAWMEHSPVGDGLPERVAVADTFAIAYRTSRRFAIAPFSIPAAWREVRHVDGTHTDALERSLSGVDWMILPEIYLDERFPVLALANDRFRVEAAFFEPGNEPALGPLAVLRRANESASKRRFVETLSLPAEHATGTTFERKAQGRVELVTLLGYATEELPGAGTRWTTWYWTTPTGLSTDLVMRVYRGDPEGVVETRLHPGQGLLDPPRWPPGRMVADARLDRAGDAADGAAVLAALFAPAVDGGAPEPLRVVAGATAELGGATAGIVAQVEPAARN
jgi:4-amino-4-deoxy-L-arabinose transferase-like glycosyltransferase